MSKYYNKGEHIIIDGVPVTGDMIKRKAPSGYYKTVVSEVKKVINLSDKIKTIIFKDEIVLSTSIYFTVVLTNGIKYEASVRNHRFRETNVTYRYGRNKKDEPKKAYYIHRHSSFDLLREHILDDVNHYYSYGDDFDITYNFVHRDKELSEESSEESLQQLAEFFNRGK